MPFINPMIRQRTFFLLVLFLAAGKAVAHAGQLNQLALDACKDKARSQACQYQGHHHDLYIGTCQNVTEEALICVRTKPIQTITPTDHEDGPSAAHSHGEKNTNH